MHVCLVPNYCAKYTMLKCNLTAAGDPLAFLLYTVSCTFKKIFLTMPKSEWSFIEERYLKMNVFWFFTEKKALNFTALNWNSER